MKFIFLQTKCCLTIIIREAHAQMSFLDLLQEDILLVEEEYNGCGSEVTVVTDTVEQVETLMHSVLWLEGHGKRFVTKMPHSNSACKKCGWSFIDGPQWQPTTSSSSTSTMSYALRAAMKMIQVTPSKQWIHFFLSERWPPTSNILQNTKISLLALVSIQAYLIQFFWLEFWDDGHWFVYFMPSLSLRRLKVYLKWRSLKENWVSMIPVVFTLDRRTSCSVGT